MPTRPGKACRVSTCSNIVTNNKHQGYCEQHKDKAGWFRHSNNKTNTQRGYGWTWQKLRATVLKRDSFLCVSCKAKGKYTKANQVDHIVPKAKGGTDSLSNLQSLCEQCHKDKTQMDSR